MKENSATPSFAALLRRHGLKATSARQLLLEALSRANHPMATHELVEDLATKVDQSTVYRTLDALTTVGVITRVEMRHAHAHYELTKEGTHHHHIICRTCNKTEDIDVCTLDSALVPIAAQTKFFRAIETHSLEFYGTCTTCATKNMKLPALTLTKHS
jgi:Fur family transcriptional regulator, ferric uptake regulator